MLTSAKGLIPLQSKMAQYANVFRLDKKAKEEDLPRTFEDHVKSVEELVAFLSNHEQAGSPGEDGQAEYQRSQLDRTSMHPTVLPYSARITDQPYQHANGDWAWSPSGQDLFRKYDNFGRGMLFQRNGSRPRLPNTDSLRLQKSPLRGRRYAAHLSEGFLILYKEQFILSRENYQR